MIATSFSFYVPGTPAPYQSIHLNDIQHAQYWIKQLTATINEANGNKESVLWEPTATTHVFSRIVRGETQHLVLEIEGLGYLLIQGDPTTHHLSVRALSPILVDGFDITDLPSVISVASLAEPTDRLPTVIRNPSETQISGATVYSDLEAVPSADLFKDVRDIYLTQYKLLLSRNEAVGAVVDVEYRPHG